MCVLILTYNRPLVQAAYEAILLHLSSIQLHQKFEPLGCESSALTARPRPQATLLFVSLKAKFLRNKKVTKMGHKIKYEKVLKNKKKG